jgi:hypothetical protein
MSEKPPLLTFQTPIENFSARSRETVLVWRAESESWSVTLDSPHDVRGHIEVRPLTRELLYSPPSSLPRSHLQALPWILATTVLIGGIALALIWAARERAKRAAECK